MMRKSSLLGFGVCAVATAILVLAPGRANAHCETLDGPVVKEARTALASGNVMPVLKWVGKDLEPELRAAFARALSVRKAGGESERLANLYFFETAVRLHRATEGAPYTGLKPAGSDLGPAVQASDAALAKGDVDGLVSLITERVAEGLRERFAHALETGKKAGSSVDEGREYVRAYVMFVHYAERIFEDAAAGPGAHHEEAPHE
jgi:hypothetical protein